MSDLKDLRKRRGILKAKLTSFNTYLSNIKSSEQLDETKLQIELKLRLEKLENLYDIFDALQSELDSLLEEPEVDERDSFESQNFSLVATARGMIETYQVDARPGASTVRHRIVLSVVPLK
ncbi:hypothetical protein ACJJTC_019169 [Scirpophaga incertulas]